MKLRVMVLDLAHRAQAGSQPFLRPHLVGGLVQGPAVCADHEARTTWCCVTRPSFIHESTLLGLKHRDSLVMRLKRQRSLPSFAERGTIQHLLDPFSFFELGHAGSEDCRNSRHE